MSNPDPDELALSFILKLEEEEDLEVSVAIRLHHIVSYVYQQAIECRAIGVRTRIDDYEDILVIGAPANEHDFLSFLRSDLEKKTFYPYGWKVDFSHFGDDCWIEALTFKSEPVVG